MMMKKLHTMVGYSYICIGHEIVYWIWSAIVGTVILTHWTSKTHRRFCGLWIHVITLTSAITSMSMNQTQPVTHLMSQRVTLAQRALGTARHDFVQYDDSILLRFIGRRHGAMAKVTI